MHRNIRNIRAPDLVGPFDGDAAQQVRVDLVTRSRVAQVRFRIERFDAQNAHQPLDALAVDFQRDGHATAAEKWEIHVQLVEPPEQNASSPNSPAAAGDSRSSEARRVVRTAVEHSDADVVDRSIAAGLQSMRPALFLRKSNSTFS